MNEPFEIRALYKSDFSAWKLLWEGYNAFYGREGNTALPLEITEATWTRFFDASEPMHAIVATHAGQIIGIAHYLFHRSTTQLNLTCYLQDLFTVESARGKGVGGALIEAVYEKAKAAGSKRVYWQTHETNLTAMRLYDKVATRSGFLVYSKVL
jgi:GNAT superfamily N-acetyltransferase